MPLSEPEHNAHTAVTVLRDELPREVILLCIEGDYSAFDDARVLKLCKQLAASHFTTYRIARSPTRPHA